MKERNMQRKETPTKKINVMVQEFKVKKIKCQEENDEDEKEMKKKIIPIYIISF